MDDTQQVWRLIERANDAWLSGRPRDTAELFDPNACLVAPGLTAVIEGRERIVQTFVEMTEATTTERFDVTDHFVRIDGDVAIATYVFEITYRAADARHTERGQEVLVLRRRDDVWRATWRTQVPLSAATEAS